MIAPLIYKIVTLQSVLEVVYTYVYNVLILVIIGLLFGFWTSFYKLKIVNTTDYIIEVLIILINELNDNIKNLSIVQLINKFVWSLINMA